MNSNILVSLLALLTILLCTLKFCQVDKRYTQSYVDDLIQKGNHTKQAFQDSLAFVNGQLELKENQIAGKQDSMLTLEARIDSLLTFRTSKNKLKDAIVGNAITDTGFVLAPNEYVNDCEFCFKTLGLYKKDNIQLRFERDNYDTLMRAQSNIQANRIEQLELEKAQLVKFAAKSTIKCDTTRKLKLSVMGMANNAFIPRAGGLGLIYEDKKFNEFGGHVLFSNAGNIYLIHAAKTISFRRKK